MKVLLSENPHQKKYNNYQIQDAVIPFTLREFSWLLGYWSRKSECPRSSWTNYTSINSEFFQVAENMQTYHFTVFTTFSPISTSCNIPIFNPTNIKETSKNKMKRFNIYYRQWWILSTLFSAYCFTCRLLYAEWNITKAWLVFPNFLQINPWEQRGKKHCHKLM